MRLQRSRSTFANSLTDAAVVCLWISMGEHQDETSVSLHVTGTSVVLLLALQHPELLLAGVLAGTSAESLPSAQLPC